MLWAWYTVTYNSQHHKHKDTPTCSLWILPSSDDVKPMCWNSEGLNLRRIECVIWRQWFYNKIWLFSTFGVNIFYILIWLFSTFSVNIFYIFISLFSTFSVNIFYILIWLFSTYIQCEHFLHFDLIIFYIHSVWTFSTFWFDYFLHSIWIISINWSEYFLQSDLHIFYIQFPPYLWIWIFYNFIHLISIISTI